MIETVMLVALGFTAAGLLALLIAPAAWRRAARLTRRRIEATMPVSVADINADKDLLRAEYAVQLRRLELALERAKARAARHLMERNRHTVEIGELEAEIAKLKKAVAERTKASDVLEQTVRKRVPELEGEVAQAAQVIAARERELAGRERAFENQAEALEMAQNMIRRQAEEIDRLRAALESGAGGGSRLWGAAQDKDEARDALVKDKGLLQAELSRLREELARVHEADASGLAELRAEMHRLADLMLSGKPAAGLAPAKAKPAKKPKASKPAQSKKPAPAETAAEKKPPAKARWSLSARLAALKPKGEKKKQKEDA